MNQKKTISNLIDIIKYPIITDKTTRDIENKVYCFGVDKNSKKSEIKRAIENIFDVKIEKINTIISPPKTKTIGKFKGNVRKYKKAIVKLEDSYTINLFENS